MYIDITVLMQGAQLYVYKLAIILYTEKLA